MVGLRYVAHGRNNIWVRAAAANITPYAFANFSDRSIQLRRRQREQE